MTPTEKGKFCSHCSKSVVDFSKFTDRELLDFFAKAKDKVCGRFNNYQLNRTIAVYEPSDASIFKRLLFGTAMAAGVAGAANGQSNAPITDNYPTTIDTKNNTIKPNWSAHVNLIILKNKNNLIVNFMTDANGAFKIAVNKNLHNKKLTIMASHYGYDDAAKDFTFTKNSPEYLTIRVNKIHGFISNNMSIGDSVVIHESPKKDSAKKK